MPDLTPERMAELRALASVVQLPWPGKTTTDAVRNDKRELLDEIERLTRWQAEAMTVMDGLQDLGQALWLPLGERITGAAALAAVERLQHQVSEEQASASNAEADYDDRGYRLWRLAAQAGHVPAESDNDATAETVIHNAIVQGIADRAERDALAAKVARVEALIETVEHRMMATAKPDEIRAALAGEQ